MNFGYSFNVALGFEDYIGAALLVVIYLWMKGRKQRIKLKQITESVA